MKRSIKLAIAFVLASAAVAVADPIRQSCSDNNCTLNIKTGSTIDIDSGGTLDLNSGSTLTGAGTADFTGTFKVESIAAAITATCAQSTEYGTNITLTITFKDAGGTAIAYSLDTELMFTTDGAGLVIVSSSTDPDGVTAVTGLTGDLTVAASTQDAYRIRTNTSGVWAGTVQKSGTDNVYPSVRIPLTGQVAACAIMDFD